MKKLAICIPTFNRADLLDRLLKSIPPSSKIIVSICDDGSNDNTREIVKKHQSRIKINYLFQRNKGRASALRQSILNVKAKFMLIMGSDDFFTKNGINTILNTIEKNKHTKFFVFSTLIQNQNMLNSESLEGIPKTNYLSLRSDYKIRRDLKEVVEHKLITNAMYKNPKNIRRIPTSYLWFKLSKKIDCLPVHSKPVITIEYSNDGMSKNLLPLKINNPKYVALTYKFAINNFNYNSIFYRIKFTILFYRYSFHNKTLKLEKYSDLPLFLLGCIFACFDIFRLSIYKKNN